jgi:hypothetical protein
MPSPNCTLWNEHRPGRFAACHFADTLTLNGALKA